jgi:hypothetical protein
MNASVQVALNFFRVFMQVKEGARKCPFFMVRPARRSVG